MKPIIAILVFFVVGTFLFASGQQEENQYIGKIVDIKSVSSGSWAAPFSAVVLLDNGLQVIILNERRIKTGIRVYLYRYEATEIYTTHRYGYGGDD